MVAIAVVGLLLAVSVPGAQRMYQSMQYREAVRDVVTVLSTARREALDKGAPQDVEIDPQARRIRLNDITRQLPEGFVLSVTAASELAREGSAVIRFYPEGGATGGDLEVTAPGGRGVHISVDWLMGSVSQVPLDNG